MWFGSYDKLTEESSLMPILAGTGTALISIGLAAMIAVLLKKKAKSSSNSAILLQQNTSNQDDGMLEIDSLPTKYDASDLTNNFEDVNEILEIDLRKNLSERIRQLKTDINVRQQEMTEALTQALKLKKEELEEANARYNEEIELIQNKHKNKIETIQTDYRVDILKMRNSLKNLKVILSDSMDEQGRLEKGRQELECPVCLEYMKPPRRIWQCKEGHPVCEFCRKKPEITCCPMCKHHFIGRSTIAEKIARAVFGDEEKITLTGYREIK